MAKRKKAQDEEIDELDMDFEEDGGELNLSSVYQFEIIASVEDLARIEKEYVQNMQARREIDEEVALLAQQIRDNPEVIAYQLATLGFSTVYMTDEGDIKPFDMTRIAIVHNLGADIEDGGSVH